VFIKTVEKGGKEKPSRLLVATASPNGGEFTPGAVSHILGTYRITVRSTASDYGSIPVCGREHLANLRDALVRICQIENIP